MAKSTETAAKNSEIRFFYEDVVYRVDKKGSIQLGMVVENSEFVSSDEEESDCEEKLQKGTIRVAWHPKGKEQVVKEEKVGLADRSLMPGDVVRRLIRGKETQRGYCRHVNVHASCQIVGTKQVIFGINSQELVSLDQFTSDVAVCLDEWVGMIRQIKSEITLRFIESNKHANKDKNASGDGKSVESVCTLPDIFAEELEDVMDKRDEECEFKRYDFFEGQILAGPLKLFEEANFISCTNELLSMRKNPKQAKKVMRVVVEKVEVVGLSIHWQCRAMNTAVKGTNDIEAQQPSHNIEGDDLKRVHMLNFFEPCTIQMGDRHFYTLKETDIICLLPEWKKLEKEFILNGSESKTYYNDLKASKKSVNDSSSRINSTGIPSKDSTQNNTIANSSIANATTSEMALKSTANESSTENQNDVSEGGDKDEQYTSDSSQEEAKTNTKKSRHNSNRQRSRTASGTAGSVPGVTVSSYQISTRGQKKKKKLKKSKNIIALETGPETIPPKSLSSELNIVHPGDKLVVETLATHSEGKC